MRISGVFPVGLPIDQIDMYRWVTEMTPAEYETFSTAHQAMGSGFRGPEFFMVNVELIGTDMLVQHYQLMEHSRSHVKFYSPRTRGLIYRWLPVVFGVPWEMTVRPGSRRRVRAALRHRGRFPVPSAGCRGLAQWSRGSSS